MKLPELVEGLEADISATAVAVIDRRRADLDTWPSGLPVSFRGALDGFPCLRPDWARVRDELLGEEESNSTCDCAARHQLHAVALQRRWVLLILVQGLVLADGSFEPAKAANYVVWVLGIRSFLEDGPLK